MNTLYELSADYKAAIANMNALLDSEDIDTKTYADTMEGLTGELSDKVVNVAMHIKNLKSELEGLKIAKAEFDRRTKSIQSNIDFYTVYLETHMLTNSILEAKNEYAEVKFRKLPDVVNILSEAAVPDNYCTVKITRTPDKKAIKESLKQGENISFATLETDRNGLQIK